MTKMWRICSFPDVYLHTVSEIVCFLFLKFYSKHLLGYGDDEGDQQCLTDISFLFFYVLIHTNWHSVCLCLV